MRQTYRPLTFFSLSLLIPWLLWFTAAYISHHQSSKTMLYIQTGLSIIGLVSPMLLALWLLRSNPGLRSDAANRLLKLGGFPKRYLLCTLLLLPFTLILAQFISLLFGTAWRNSTSPATPHLAQLWSRRGSSSFLQPSLKNWPGTAMAPMHY